LIGSFDAQTKAKRWSRTSFAREVESGASAKSGIRSRSNDLRRDCGSRRQAPQEAARREAESVLLDRRYFALGTKTFNAFVEKLDAPPKPDARLRRLLREKAPWNR